MKQRSEAWFQARAGRITGSRFSRAMAGKRSNNYRNLIDELAEERRRGRSLDGGYVNAAMQWGIDHEDAARRWYGRSRGCRVETIGFVVHPQHDYVGVSPDGLVAHDGLVEIKCPQAKGFNRVLESQEMPARYRWQVQGQLWVCQRDWADFVCFYPPGKGIVMRVFGNRSDFDALEERCREVNLEVERRLGAGRPSQNVPGRSTSPSTVPLPMAGAIPMAPRRQSDDSGVPTWFWILLVVVGLILLNQ